MSNKDIQRSLWTTLRRYKGKCKPICA
ncbi:unnamed protein product [Linum tenue]|uniref:Uncharacterized protein n=1 Tax=Linum tenue TaxID=586396 RepID=A0AAV0NWT2_9ROSI|nr:unnamed protein product [Linum tenue]CAI0462825.1 unnamed protein product [Linum tenue]CAI0462879.1 unnamed protein product [Linum tenue]